MKEAVFTKRERNMRLLVLLNFGIYALFRFALNEQAFFYVFLRKTVDDFDGSDYASFDMFVQGVHFICLMALLPFVSGLMLMHDAALLFLFSASGCIGHIVSALSSGRIWMFYLGMGLKGLDISNYSILRSLVTMCTHPDEQGKMFSGLAFVAAILPLISEYTMTSLYNGTLDQFPGAFLLFGASCYALAAIIAAFIWSQHGNMLVDRKGNPINEGHRIINDEQSVSTKERK